MSHKLRIVNEWNYPETYFNKFHTDRASATNLMIRILIKIII